MMTVPAKTAAESPATLVVMALEIEAQGLYRLATTQGH
jgi:hypothetical protein